MCGIIGIVGRHGSHVNQALYDGLTVLQHRGQDAAGIMTEHNEKFNLRKGNGLVSDVFYKTYAKIAWTCRYWARPLSYCRLFFHSRGSTVLRKLSIWLSFGT
ncbi:hypothetical protein N9V76_05500 [Candidatus Poseidoniales archaeon]|nr:hypothetical protein [Candidatus Poseidoniales archaeon]